MTQTDAVAAGEPPNTGTTQTQPAVQADPNQAAPAAAPPAPDLLAQLHKAQSDVDRFKGFQDIYTRGKQSGVWDGVERYLEGANPAEAQARWNRAEQAIQVLDEVEKMGGWDQVKRDWRLINDPNALSELEGGAPPKPQAAQPEPGISKDDMQRMVQSAVQAALSTRDVADAQTRTATNLVQQYGLATKTDSTDPYVLDLIAGALERDLRGVTQGVRDPTPEEVALAGQRVAQALFVPLRVQGAGAPIPAPNPNIPPGMNAKQPSGQQPTKPPGQMTREERSQAARQRVREILQPTHDASGPAPQLPDDGLHSFS